MREYLMSKRAKLICAWLMSALLFLGTAFQGKAFASDEIEPSKIYKYSTSYVFTSLANGLIGAEQDGKTAIEMGSDAANAGNVNITPQFKKWYSGKDWSGAVKKRSVGWIAENIITFKAGSDIVVENVDFIKRRANDIGAKVVIEEGAKVRFINSKFSNTVENNGVAIFENVTFATGDIKNNGTAEYVNTTVPTNIGTPKEKPQFIPLSLVVEPANLQATSKGKIVDYTVLTTLGGTNKDTAVKSVSILPANSGLTASWNGSEIKVVGTAAEAGDYTITAKVESVTDTNEADVVEKQISLKVNKTIEAKLEGALQDYAVGEDAASIDAVSSATGSGGITKQNESIKIYIKEDGGEWQTYNEFAIANQGTEIAFNFTPDSNGLTATQLLGSVMLSGNTKKAGAYGLSATVSQGGREATTNVVPFNVFDLNVPFADRLAQLDPATEYWMMAPWKMDKTAGGATIPANLKKIYGSNESGLYG